MPLTNTTRAQDQVYEAMGEAQALVEDLDKRLTEALDELAEWKKRAEEAEATIENYAEIIQHYDALMQ